MIEQWKPDTEYKLGDEVMFGIAKWRATKKSRGVMPGGAPDFWLCQGTAIFMSAEKG